jgi:glycosyltransferase involved in cell wall biosynthesis
MMKVSLIIPTLNESEVLEKTFNFIPRKSLQEIIVVDGHSTDKTREIARSLGCRVFLQPHKGYGEALTYGVNKAKGDVVIFMDADSSQDPKAIPRLVKKINEGYEMVLGSRYIEGAGSEDDTLIRYIGNKFFTFLANKIHKLNITDSLYLFTAIRKDAFKKINPTSHDMEFCVEIIIKARKKGIKITEIPIRELKRLAGNSKVNVFYHGFRILFWLLKKY